LFSLAKHLPFFGSIGSDIAIASPSKLFVKDRKWLSYQNHCI
jgi:hypothetical protein